MSGVRPWLGRPPPTRRARAPMEAPSYRAASLLHDPEPEIGQLLGPAKGDALELDRLIAFPAVEPAHSDFLRATSAPRTNRSVDRAIRESHRRPYAVSNGGCSVEVAAGPPRPLRA